MSETPRGRGRPLKFETPEFLQNQVDLYFERCKDPEDDTKWKIPPTISGLALALDTTRDVLLDYENLEERADYSNTIKKAKQTIHAFNEEQLYRNTQVTGVIFNLKNNFDWKDKTETDLTSGGKELKASLVQFIDANSNNTNTD